MKIEIKNLGPIHYFEFDLEKDLHLLYGGNNVGKSFAVNVVYCVLKSVINSGDEKLERLIELDDSNLSKEVKYLIRYKQDLFMPLENSLKNTYSKLTGTQINQGQIIINYSSKVRVEINVDNSGKLILNEDKFLKEVERFLSENKDTFIQYFLMFRNDKRVSNVELYLLPSGRSGLYAPLSGMGEIFAELSQMRNKLKSKIEIPALQEPVSDYYLDLMSAEKEGQNKEIVGLGQKIENEILNGTVFLDSHARKIYFKPNNSTQAFHITETSSMVAELAPLVLFLKNKVSPIDDSFKTILIIEEPEAHLHPEIQVKLMEIFAELTKHNVKVILTSHSNYMFNKVSNMLLKGEIEPKKVGVYHMDMTEKGSVVRPDMQATEEGIEDHNFVDVAEDLYNERVETYEKLNAQTNAAK